MEVNVLIVFVLLVGYASGRGDAQDTTEKEILSTAIGGVRRHSETTSQLIALSGIPASSTGHGAGFPGPSDSLVHARTIGRDPRVGNAHPGNDRKGARDNAIKHRMRRSYVGDSALRRFEPDSAPHPRPPQKAGLGRHLPGVFGPKKFKGTALSEAHGSPRRKLPQGLVNRVRNAKDKWKNEQRPWRRAKPPVKNNIENGAPTPFKQAAGMEAAGQAPAKKTPRSRVRDGLQKVKRALKKKRQPKAKSNQGKPSRASRLRTKLQTKAKKARSSVNNRVNSFRKRASQSRVGKAASAGRKKINNLRQRARNGLQNQANRMRSRAASSRRNASRQWNKMRQRGGAARSKMASRARNGFQAVSRKASQGYGRVRNGMRGFGRRMHGYGRRMGGFGRSMFGRAKGFFRRRG